MRTSAILRIRPRPRKAIPVLLYPLLSLLLIWLCGCGASTQIPAVAAVSISPGEVWPDTNGVHINAHGGGVLYHEGLYYWFGEHKIEGRAGNRAMVGVHCYSSSDLGQWTDEGIALEVSEDPNSEIVKGNVIERPKVIHNQKTGKFVMWFHLELAGQGYSAARTGVAVSDRVTGPYTYLRSYRPNAGTWPLNFPEEQKTGAVSPDPLEQGSDEWKAASLDGGMVRRDFEGGQMARDMTLFVDDDGTAYHIHASEENGTLHISELSDDYLSFTDRWARAFLGGHNEAPAVFKAKGKYYMITSGCTGWAPNPGRSSVADSMLGEWRALGNPSRGTEEQNATTFESQSTHILPVQGKPDAFIFMGDRWRPKNPIDGRYIWLPIQWEDDKPVLKWMDEWSLESLD
jgi:glycosyl hydrolase family 43